MQCQRRHLLHARINLVPVSRRVPLLRLGEMKYVVQQVSSSSCCRDPVPQQNTIHQFLMMAGSYFKIYIFSPCTQWMQLISLVDFVP